MFESSQELAMRVYQELKTAERPREMKRWHASSIAQCPRAQFYSRLGIEHTNHASAGLILRWQAGHAIEGVVRGPLKKIVPDLESNIRFTSDKLDLTGELDNYSQANQAIIEIKSVSSHAVRYRRVDEDRHHLRDNKQYYHHELQQACYVKLLEEQGLPISQIIYFYVTLDGLIVPYRTEINDEALAYVNDMLTYLNKCWEAQELPLCLCDHNDHDLYKPVFQYCSYKGEGGECCSPQLFYDSFKEAEDGATIT